MSFTVSDDQHYFQAADGTPFFYLADTVWLLFGKLTLDEARTLFQNRQAKGFTVIQACVFRDLFEPNTPNVAGDRPFASDADMAAVRLNPKWLAHVDLVIGLAAEHGLTIGLLPTWGDKWNEFSNSAGPVIMDRDSGRAYCRHLSDALAHHDNLLWILGGDSPVQTQAYADTVSAMAEGLRAGGSGDKPITFHPIGPGSSAIFHSQPWLTFNALQTGHDKPNAPNYANIERLWRLSPTKPCLDLEANYEVAPMFSLRKHGWQEAMSVAFTAYDVRKQLYRSVLAGAAGFSYGCDPIRQVYRPGDRLHAWRVESMPYWFEVLDAPGSGQLQLLKDLLLARSYFTRVPAQELLIPHADVPPWTDALTVGMPAATQLNLDPVAHIRVARCTEGSWVMAYIPVRQWVTLDTSGLKSRRLRVSVYDPETRERTHVHELDAMDRLPFMPTRDLDTLVVVDALSDTEAEGVATL